MARDLSGKRFGRWQVVRKSRCRKNGKIYWVCRCDCGTEKVVCGELLVRLDSKSCGCFRREQVSKANRGDKNGNWKGDKVGYNSLHEWVRKHKPRSLLCVCCGLNKSYDLANISGEYKRDIDDYEWLCRMCHMTKDGRLAKLVMRNKQKNNANI